MLVEIRCDGFKSSKGPRGPIIFRKGLNTVLGGLSAENSIGKTTMLSIIDFCFGGNTFPSEKVMEHLDVEYPINFTFEFDGIQYSFSRGEAEPNAVWICNRAYERIEKKDIKAFTDFLNEHYCSKVNDMTFREFVGIQTRYYGRGKIDPSKPLDAYGKSGKTCLEWLEKVFNQYDVLGPLKGKYDDAEKKLKALKSARDYAFLPKEITKTTYDNNLDKIDELTKDLQAIIKSTDKEMTQEDFEKNLRAEELRAEINKLKRNRRNLVAKKNLIERNLNDKKVPESDDLNQLRLFFPNANFERLEFVSTFHRKISSILSSEMSEELNVVNLSIESLEREIKAKEEKLRAQGELININKKSYEEYASKKQEISEYQAANKSYENESKMKENKKNLSEDLEVAETEVLNSLFTTINKRLAEYNAFIYGPERIPPTFELTKNMGYVFETKNDRSTGVAYKSMMIFDLAMLALTDIPYVIHDSLLFKNVADQPIQKILELYSKEKEKQIFIAFDKSESYTEEVQRILADSVVLQLGDNGDELYGKSWAKR